LHKNLNLPLIKIASGEITNFPLLLKIARNGQSVILSTGMSTLGDIEAALGILAYGYLHSAHTVYPDLRLCEQAYFSETGQEKLSQKVSLLHCTSEYPAPVNEVNLRAMSTLHSAFGLTTGYSDHTQGIAIAMAAVACGAQIIEKHFTLDKNMVGPDHQASLAPDELVAMVSGIRQVEAALGRSQKMPTASELKNRSIARKSLVALQKINPGDVFGEHNVGCKRPGNGLSPHYFSYLKNKCAGRSYEADELIEFV
jgi:sialic acid synthase SpsE